MSVHNPLVLDASGGMQAAGLLMMGPLLPVELHVSAPLAASLTAQNQPIPQPVSGWALVDTGATFSAMHEGAAVQLELQTIRTVTTGTAAGPKQQPVFPARVSFPGIGIDVGYAALAGVDLTGQRIDGKDILVLIGRDMLSGWLFVYNGPAGMFTIAH